ncbi:hypothetical protein [Gloeothece verrucosa]|uniref:hypothetical protein n=1 Tax=Gloeothece verrucosa TaxID=2546359 RepID=UPI0002DB9C3E|nr:hypothetical protein [Gloeothece verrucosa]
MAIEEFNKFKEEALSEVNSETTETSSSPLSRIEEFVTLIETVEETLTPVIEEEQIYLSAEELTKNYTKAQLIELAANNNIKLPKTGKICKNQLVEFLAALIPAAH